MNDNRAKLSRRAFLRLAGASAAGMALSACGLAGSRATPTPSGPVQLVYQDWRTDWFPAMAQEMLDIFNAEHPNIRVFYTPDPENLEEKMPADMAAGTASDVISGCCEFFSAWANSGYLLDLRERVSADLDQETIDDWDAAQYKALFTADGLQFGLPHAALLRQPCGHCAKFLTAASRRSLARVPVPVWLIILSDQLPVVALGGRYPTN